MMHFLIFTCGLISGLVHGADQFQDRLRNNVARPWTAWGHPDKDDRTWYEWWNGFRVRNVYQYADALIGNEKKTEETISIMDIFKGHEQFKQDREQRNWLNFCEKKTEKLLNMPVDSLTRYHLEEFIDCCGKPIRTYAMKQPQRYKNMIELVNDAEKVLIAMKALQSKTKAQKGNRNKVKDQDGSCRRRQVTLKYTLN